MQLIAQQIPSLLFQSSSNTDAAWNEPRAHRAILSQAARQVLSFTLKSKKSQNDLCDHATGKDSQAHRSFQNQLHFT